MTPLGGQMFIEVQCSINHPIPMGSNRKHIFTFITKQYPIEKTSKMSILQ